MSEAHAITRHSYNGGRNAECVCSCGETICRSSEQDTPHGDRHDSHTSLPTHDHTGPDNACPACKPLADVIRDRMRWPSLHWGELHPDAYASIARAVHEAGYQLTAEVEHE